MALPRCDSEIMSFPLPWVFRPSPQMSRTIRLLFLLPVVLSIFELSLHAQDPAQSPGSASASGPTNSTDPALSGSLPPITTSITVNGTLTSESPANITPLNSTQIQLLPGTELDDRLRQIPGFSLFRRSSSVVANPTTQGISLRGTGSTGASRTLLLWDGIPMNDPFGGWVYWDRFDPYYLERIEVQRGAPTSIFGDRAMTGTINLFSPPEKHQYVSADVIGGGQGTVDAAGSYSNLWGPWGLSVHSRGLTTDGYYITPDYARGTVDQRANVRFATGNVNLDYLGTSDRLSIHFDVLAEERHNGTLLTHNSTGLGTIGANYTHSWQNDQLSFLAFHTQGQFHSTYSSVSANRNTENLTAKQTVPEYDVGGALYWRHHARRWNTFTGADVDDIHGTSFDYSYNTHVLTPNGGTLLQHGVFAQGDLTLGPVTFSAGIRHQFTGERGDTFVSPNGGAVVGWKQLRFRTSGYKSFRAPTLNELYRPFRVGNVMTLANANLVPEGLIGVEAGVDWVGERTRASLTVFHNDLNNLVDNATISTSPTLILRQRQNFPGAVSRGVEASITRRWRNWTGEAGYLYADSRLGSGARIPQVPKNQGTAQMMYARKNTQVSFGVRAFSLQFDDDLNQFRLPGYAALQASANQGLGHGLSAVATVENLLDRSYLVALTPNPNIGSPRLWRVGLRWSGSVH
jgi:outer membrane cobalamin receptor